jgi:hypothetical protein
LGIALLIAWVADSLLRKQFRRTFIRALIAFLPVVLWQSYVHSVESSDSYKHPYYAYQRAPWMFYNVSYATNVSLKEPFHPELGRVTSSDVIARIAANLLEMPRFLGQSVSAKEEFWIGHGKRLSRLVGSPSFPGWIIQAGLVILGSIVVGGIVLMFVRCEWLVPGYLLLTVAAMSTTVWPGQFPRYLAPLQPFLLIAFLNFLFAIKAFAFGRYPRMRFAAMIPAAVSAVILGESVSSSVVGYRNFRDPAVYPGPHGTEKSYSLYHYPPAAAASEEGLTWLAAHADRDAIVAVSMPQWVYLKTGLRTVMPPLSKDPKQAESFLDSVPVTYIVLDQLLMEQNFNQRFPAVVHNDPGRWRIVFASPRHEFDIYQRVGLRSSDLSNPGSPHTDVSLRF